MEEYLSQLANGAVAVVAAQLSEEEFDKQLHELSLDVPLLPNDFSRADIYLDHD